MYIYIYIYIYIYTHTPQCCSAMPCKCKPLRYGVLYHSALGALYDNIISAQIRAYDDRALCCLHTGVPYRKTYALSSYALTCAAPWSNTGVI